MHFISVFFILFCTDVTFFCPLRQQCCRFTHTPEHTWCAIMWGLVYFIPLCCSCFSDQRRITTELSLSVQVVITIRHQTGKKGRKWSQQQMQRTKSFIKRKTFSTNHKSFTFWRGGGVFEFLSFLVRQLNSNESGRVAPANCAGRVADLDVYSNDHRSTSECKLLYASTWS